MNKFCANLSVFIAAFLQIKIIVDVIKFVKSSIKPNLLWIIIAIGCWTLSDYIAKKFIEDFYPELKNEFN